MIIDKRLELSDAQAVSADAGSTNTVDFGGDFDVGAGRPLYLVVTCDVALAGTSPTLVIKLQTDDNSSFSSATDLVSSQSFSALAAGAQVVLPMPDSNERYVRAYYDVGGTTPTVTLSAFLTDQEPRKLASYPDAI